MNPIFQHLKDKIKLPDGLRWEYWHNDLFYDTIEIVSGEAPHIDRYILIHLTPKTGSTTIKQDKFKIKPHNLNAADPNFLQKATELINDGIQNLTLITPDTQQTRPL